MTQRIEWLSSLPLKYLVAATAKKLLGFFHRKARFEWTVYEVSHSIFPDSDARNYYDARSIRSILTNNGIGRVGIAAELACGYGRLVPVLSEFSDQTFGLEREANLAAIGQRHIRDVNFINIGDLLEVERAIVGPVDLVMIITVLQHLTDEKNRLLAQALAQNQARRAPIAV